MSELLFGTLLIATVLQRLLELRIARHNYRKLIARGAREFGARHYPLIVGMHVCFFIALIFEYRGKHSPLSVVWPIFLALFAFAQLGRAWVLRTMRGRWTTRVVAIPGEQLIAKGPFRVISHPNYVVVALELFALPMIFDLWITATVFSIINAIVLLKMRLPVEKRALKWAQGTID